MLIYTKTGLYFISEDGKVLSQCSEKAATIHVSQLVDTLPPITAD